jgi:hypothetical protein
MNEGQLTRALAAGNAWWRDPQWERGDRDQKTSGKEVDFCGPRLGKLGFEGKYVDSSWRREALTVRAALGAGVLATRGLLDTGGDVWAVPAPLIAWMLND